jgi:hypothetical protein
VLEIHQGIIPETTQGEPPLREWAEDGKRFASLHQDPTGFRMAIDGVGAYSIDPDHPSITMSKGDPFLLETYLWQIPAAICFMRRGDLPLHASAAEIDGHALLFAAPGGHGKTTLVSAFMRAGHRVLSEDLACCRVNDHPAVLPGPAVLRVRPRSYEQLEFPDTELAVDYPWSKHLALTGRARGDGAPVPIAGIVLLRQGDHLSLERVPTPGALREIWTMSFKLPLDQDRAIAFDRLGALADRVPIWNLSRPFRFDNLDQVVDAVISTCLS